MKNTQIPSKYHEFANVTMEISWKYTTINIIFSKQWNKFPLDSKYDST